MKKQPHLIELKVLQLGAKQVNRDMRIQVVWKRKQDKQRGSICELNEFEVDT